jgi:hypothetical protein
MNVLLMLMQLLVSVVGIVANGLLFGAGFAVGAMLVEKRLHLK